MASNLVAKLDGVSIRERAIKIQKMAATAETSAPGRPTPAGLRGRVSPGGQRGVGAVYCGRVRQYRSSRNPETTPPNPGKSVAPLAPSFGSRRKRTGAKSIGSVKWSCGRGACPIAPLMVTSGGR
jgi:hypothetical protein